MGAEDGSIPAKCARMPVAVVHAILGHRGTQITLLLEEFVIRMLDPGKQGPVCAVEARQCWGNECHLRRTQSGQVSW